MQAQKCVKDDVLKNYKWSASIYMRTTTIKLVEKRHSDTNVYSSLARREMFGFRLQLESNIFPPALPLSLHTGKYRMAM